LFFSFSRSQPTAGDAKVPAAASSDALQQSNAAVGRSPSRTRSPSLLQETGPRCLETRDVACRLGRRGSAFFETSISDEQFRFFGAWKGWGVEREPPGLPTSQQLL